MKQDTKEKWIAALKSGTYAQGRGFLHNPEQGTYCCLGVLADIQEAWFDEQRLSAPLPEEGDTSFTLFRGVPGDTIGHYIADMLTRLNDTGKSFSFIADWIHANVATKEE